MKRISLEEVVKNLDSMANRAMQGPIQPTRMQLMTLRSALLDERLVLVLGAGVSRACGLLDWATLLRRLLITTIADASPTGAELATDLAKAFDDVFRVNPLIAGRFLQLFYEKRSPETPMAFLNAIRDTLYSGLKTRESPLLGAIGALAKRSKLGRIKAVITYNFDDLLEHALMGQKISVRPIYKQGQSLNSKELPVYHVHGFLPRSGELKAEHQVVFSERLYHEQYRDDYGWANLAQINAFKDDVCLFLGSSLTDPNQRRLLEIGKAARNSSNHNHFTVRRRHQAQQIQERVERALKIVNSSCAAANPFADAGATLVQVIERFEVDDARSFGVDTIWTDQYEDIPSILRAIGGNPADQKSRLTSAR